MSSFFRNLNENFTNKRENAIKEAILNALKDNIKSVEEEILLHGRDILEQCELSSALCTTLESLFLHGLKDSLLWQAYNALAGGADGERRPEPSFWSPLLVFLHKQDIDQIQGLSQITSEIGQCRSWIRLSLKDSLLSSYLETMSKNSSALSPYYKKHAFVRDVDGVNSAIKLLQPLETSIQFEFNLNSSLLNQWPEYALQLSGLWTPSLKVPILKPEPISSGIDIAGTLAAEAVDIPSIPQPVSTNTLFAESISNSPFSHKAMMCHENDLTQSERHKLFLDNVEELDMIAEEANKVENTEAASSNSQNDAQIKPSKSKKKSVKSLDLKADYKNLENISPTEEQKSTQSDYPLNSSAHGNSLSNLMRNSWCSDGSDGLSLASSTSRAAHSYSRTSSTCTPLEDYNALLQKHENSRNVDWTIMWEKFLAQNNANALGLSAPLGGGDIEEDALTLKSNNGEEFSEEPRSSLDFELIPKFALTSNFDIVELQEMVEQLYKLAREPGLDAQGFLCKLCQHPLGIGYSKINVCGFSGNYYCERCMDIEPVLIPARIIYNWDFRKYKVSKRAAAFLAEFRNQPYIDLKLLNPEIYTFSEPMAELQSLRIRLNFIRAYLSTCSGQNFEILRKEFYGREYLYEHIHQYSIGDLSLIQRGTLNQQLQKAYKIGEAHVLKCQLCSVKGFICEICNGHRVLYPFHINTTFRCESCGAVFHAQCLNDQQPCPKCERRQKRELLKRELSNEEEMENLQLNEKNDQIIETETTENTETLENNEN